MNKCYGCIGQEWHSGKEGGQLTLDKGLNEVKLAVDIARAVLLDSGKNQCLLLLFGLREPVTELGSFLFRLLKATLQLARLDPIVVRTLLLSSQSSLVATFLFFNFLCQRFHLYGKNKRNFSLLILRVKEKSLI